MLSPAFSLCQANVELFKVQEFLSIFALMSEKQMDKIRKQTMFDGLGFLPFLCSCVSVNVGLCQPHEEYGDFYSAKLITERLEEKPVLTINFTSIGSQALMWDAGETEMKGGTPMPNKVPCDGKSKGQHNGDNGNEGDGNRLCRAPGKRQTVRVTLLLPHLQASPL